MRIGGIFVTYRDYLKDINYLDWYFGEDDGGADKDVVRAYEHLRGVFFNESEKEEGIAPIESTTEQKIFADRIGFAVSEFWCGACHFNLVGRPKFCPNCGKKVKWDG